GPQRYVAVPRSRNVEAARQRAGEDGEVDALDIAEQAPVAAEAQTARVRALQGDLDAAREVLGRPRAKLRGQPPRLTLEADGDAAELPLEVAGAVDVSHFAVAHDELDLRWKIERELLRRVLGRLLQPEAAVGGTKHGEPCAFEREPADRELAPREQ